MVCLYLLSIRNCRVTFIIFLIVDRWLLAVGMNVEIVKTNDRVDHASWANACQSGLRSSMFVFVCVCVCVCVMLICVPLVSVHVPQHSYAFICFLSIIHGL